MFLQNQHYNILASDVIQNILFYFNMSLSVLESFVYAIGNFITITRSQELFCGDPSTCPWKAWWWPFKDFFANKNWPWEICAQVSEADPLPADSWKPNQESKSQTPEVRLNCEQGWHINMINFASIGTPRGNCGTFTPGICDVNVTSIVQQLKKLLLVHV